MMMFDNAIFATFIPQFLMVVAFVTCLISPNKIDKTNVEASEFQIIVQNYNHVSTSTFVTNADFYFALNENKSKNYFVEQKFCFYPIKIHFSINEKCDFHFSRPPPIYLL
jgi:hypothetical protein